MPAHTKQPSVHTFGGGWRAWGVALLAAAGYGLLAGWGVPRGPVSTSEGFASLTLGLLVGLAAGRLLRSRWAMLLAPLAFVLAFELTRLGVTGPTVDGIHLGSTYGVLAFTVGRGVHGLLTLVPMALGAALGAARARRAPSVDHADGGSDRGRWLWLRRGVAVATGTALVAVAAFVARPAATDPIVDAAGDEVAGSVAELTRVEIGGHELALMLRGRSEANPVLLFLAGGPGGSELGAMRRHSQSLEDDFVVATLDQRGTGKSYDQLDPTSSLSLDRAVTDTLEVTDYLRDRFGQDRVYLAGQSWGSLLGVLAVQRQPELFRAFVGVGQMVSPAETDRIFYRDTLAWARENGDTDLVETLTRNGPPPYTDMLDYEPALSHEQELYPYDHTGNSEGSGQMGENIFVEEYTLLEQLHLFGGFLDTFSVLYPQIQDIDLRTQASVLDVPVYLAQGAHEAPGRAGPAREWFDLLQAPSKELVTFDTSGHRPLWEQPDSFHDLMATVLVETTGTARDDRETGRSVGEVERVLTGQLDSSGVPGGAVAVVSQGRIDARGVGSAGGGRDVTADTPFVLGSASKSFTALAVMQLVDAGTVDLDAPVRDYVPELELGDGQPVDDITVRHLLQQTSGLDDLTGGPLLASAEDGTPLEAVAELEGAELASPPGETWRYANANYVLAGLVVERASGLGYADYVHQKIFTPLGMTRSSAHIHGADGGAPAEGHRFLFGIPVGTEPLRREATLAAGYLTSTANDLGRYLSLYLADGVGPDGTRIVSAEGVRTLLEGGPDAALGAWAQGQESRYAMGWFVGGPWGEDAVFHPGNTPDTTTMLSVFPDRGVAVATMVGAGNELPVPGNPFIADRVTRNVVHSALGQPVPDLPSLWRFYAGFDLAALLLLGSAAWGLLRAVRAAGVPLPSRHPVRGWVGVLVRTAAAGLLAVTPTLSYGWGGLWTWAPDLALVIAALALLLAFAAALRAFGLLRGRLGTRAAASASASASASTFASTSASTSEEQEHHHVSP